MVNEKVEQNVSRWLWKRWDFVDYLWWKLWLSCLYLLLFIYLFSLVFQVLSLGVVLYWSCMLEYDAKWQVFMMKKDCTLFQAGLAGSIWCRYRWNRRVAYENWAFLLKVNTKSSGILLSRNFQVSASADT